MVRRRRRGKKRAKPNKVLGERRHAIKRCRQRFGINLTTREYEDISGQIKRGQSTFIEQQTNRVTLHIVEFNGVKARVAFDKKRSQIITFMTLLKEESGPSTQ